MKSVLVADDHSLIRKGICYILSQTEDLRVRGEAATAEEALELVRVESFDLVILDAIMPGRGGLDVIRDLRKVDPKLKIIVLSIYTEKQLARRSYKEGADAFICKNKTDGTLIPAIRTILAGKRFVTRETADCLIDFLINGDDLSPHERLSQREIQVLVMIGAGWTRKKIAEELSLSVKTINAHRASIMDKMGFASTTELIKYVVDHKLLP